MLGDKHGFDRIRQQKSWIVWEETEEEGRGVLGE